MNVPSSRIEWLRAGDAAALAEVRALFQEYATSLSVDLCFQGFAEELAGLPGDYQAPRGALLVVRVGPEWAGCCALRALDTSDYPNACEMKRLYVRPGHRGAGLGRVLAQAMLDEATRLGYAYLLLDTLDDMEAARALYEDLGFVEVDPYYHNPIAGAHYLMARLG